MTATVLLSDLRSRGFLVSVVDEGILVKPSKFLTDDDRQAISAHKSELLDLLTSVSVEGRCPGCAGEMNLQDRARDAWWCPACRRWADGRGRPLAGAAPPKTRQISREPEEARKLLDDLRAAGCVFVIEDGELRLRYPSRMSVGLWSRFENAGHMFIKLAREAAERDASCRD